MTRRPENSAANEYGLVDGSPQEFCNDEQPHEPHEYLVGMQRFQCPGLPFGGPSAARSHDSAVCEDGVVRRYLRELAEGWRVLRSREFWRAFHDYWFGDGLKRRLDEFAERLRGESHDGR